ncbi:hypothetical protein B9Z55_013168 [Caenorhabditis nigoni]|uniref:DUF281 domain-containing protein n=1 Tax=Caenorhabditis nigoni TaxID=1611254 RepID=A0A2G5U0E1_9PELO|nr:hypothetical protein B9Z55_013168 [Caenorhabditis nigoni]
MSRFIILLYLIALPLVDLCVRTIPPEDVGFTTTQVWDDVTTEAEEETTVEEVTTEESTTVVEENLCGTCDIADIVPSGGPKIDVNTIQRDPVDGCIVTYVVCQRIDAPICPATAIQATTADGTVDVTDTSTDDAAWSTFTCGKDGKYGHKSTLVFEKKLKKRNSH